LNNSEIALRRENAAQAWIRWGITVLWAALIFTLSTETYGGSFSALLLRDFLDLIHVTVSVPTFNLLHHLLRKSAHFTEYAIFSMLLYHCLLGSNRTTWRLAPAAWSVIIAGTYSLTDEFHQIFVPGRGASLWDCGIDTVGATAGILLIYGWTCFIGVRTTTTLPKEQTADPV
jgi:VanZ family protein